jgi:hypothetical protein
MSHLVSQCDSCGVNIKASKTRDGLCTKCVPLPRVVGSKPFVFPPDHASRHRPNNHVALRRVY